MKELQHTRIIKMWSNRLNCPASQEEREMFVKDNSLSEREIVVAGEKGKKKIPRMPSDGATASKQTGEKSQILLSNVLNNNSSVRLSI